MNCDFCATYDIPRDDCCPPPPLPKLMYCFVHDDFFCSQCYTFPTRFPEFLGSPTLFRYNHTNLVNLLIIVMAGEVKPISVEESSICWPRLINTSHDVGERKKDVSRSNCTRLSKKVLPTYKKKMKRANALFLHGDFTYRIDKSYAAL